MIKLKPTKQAKGSIVIPSDKSISHRAAILNAIAYGTSHISNYSNGGDCKSTLEVISALGVDIRTEKRTNSLDVTILGKGIEGMSKPNNILDVGNSGTTTRLLSGILASTNFASTLSGDESLNSRPMKRIIAPLEEMGAIIESNNYTAPLKFSPSSLKGITYYMNVASAQVKSCILIAGLFSNSSTRIHQLAISRDHTERMLESMGASLEINDLQIGISPSSLQSIDVEIPGDISSAAFWLVAGTIHPKGDLTLRNVGINPTRKGVIDILKIMGANIELFNHRNIANEPVCDIKVVHSQLRGTEISGDILPSLIDEIPILLIAAAMAQGSTLIKDATELRIKETDRLFAISKFFKDSGIRHELFEDGMLLEGNGEFKGGNFESFGDHRIAMAIAISSIVASGETEIDDHQVASVSYKNFWEDLFTISK